MNEVDRAPAITSVRLGVLLVACGALLAIDSYLGLGLVPKMWPLLLTLQAFGLIGMHRKSRGRGGGFLVVGVYVGCFSLLALYCNFTSWAQLAWLWPLSITFLALAYLVLFVFGGRARGNLLVGLALFSLSLVFLIVGIWGIRYWWTVLVLAGLSILVSEAAKR